METNDSKMYIKIHRENNTNDFRTQDVILHP